jgi:YggT family protein
MVSQVIVILVIASVLLSYFLPPYNNVRIFLDRLVEPLLMPIRRFMPRTGMIDFSPLVLLILVQILEFIIVRLLISLA